MRNQKGFTLWELLAAVGILIALIIGVIILSVMIFVKAANAEMCDYTVHLDSYVLYKTDSISGERTYIERIKVRDIYEGGPSDDMKGWVTLIPCNEKEFGKMLYIHGGNILNIRDDGLHTWTTKERRKAR